MMGLAAENRRAAILEQLRLSGRIGVVKIAKQLGVTAVTIRRDLDYLVKRQLVKKTYGGAVLAGAADMDVFVKYRQTRKMPAKKTIGGLASGLVSDGDVIYLEAGSTCGEIIPYLADFANLTVIVNSVGHMSRLHEQPQHKIIVTGGQYRAEQMDMIGPVAQATICELGGFKAFTGADDISIRAGISGADVPTVNFAKLVVRQAAKVVFVGDHTKFDRPALYKIADIDELDVIVTDVKPKPKWIKAAAEKAIRLVYLDD